MISIALALVLSRVSPTTAQARGAIEALYAAQVDLANRSITSSAAHQACVGFAGTKPAGTVTIRVGVALLSAAAQRALGAAPLVDGDGKERPWVYGALEIQAVPLVLASPLPPLPAWLRILDMDEVEVRAAPVWPACEIAIVREGFTPSPWRCACRGAGTCTWTPPLVGGGVGASTVLPKNLTAPPGTWTGGGCVPKPCLEWDGDDSMPAACRQ